MVSKTTKQGLQLSTLAAIEVKQVESFSLLSPPVSIPDQRSYDEASLFLRDRIKKEIYSLDEDFKAMFEGARAQRKLYNKLKKPLQAMEAEVKRLMAQFKTEERQQQQAAVEKIRKELESAQQGRVVEEVTGLFNAGHMTAEEAAELMAAKPEEGSDLIPLNVSFEPEKTEGSHTVTNKTFEMIDEAKLKQEYRIPSTPDTTKILRTVKAHGREAEEMVGRGAIRYKEEITIVSVREKL